MVEFVYTGWQSLLRIVVVGTAMYVSLIVFLRLSGSRTLATLNIFDFIVTVAIGSVFGRALTADRVSLAEGLTAFALLVTLQYLVARLKTRWPRFEDAITNPPELLYYDGSFMRESMQQSRVSERELRTVLRKNKFKTMGDVGAVVLEPNGELSVIHADAGPSVLEDVRTASSEYEE